MVRTLRVLAGPGLIIVSLLFAGRFFQELLHDPAGLLNWMLMAFGLGILWLAFVGGWKA